MNNHEFEWVEIHKQMVKKQPNNWKQPNQNQNGLPKDLVSEVLLEQKSGDEKK
jgi:hypothetical protein